MIDPIILEEIESINDGFKEEHFEGKRVLVTGGAGFLGSWLADVLISLGAKVTCLDNLSSGKMENIDHLIEERKFEFLHEDVCSFESDIDYDYILHLASLASPECYQRFPITTLRTNSIGSYHLLEYTRRHNVTILLASTSEVYGNANLFPTPESYEGNVNPIGPRSCYDEGKRFAEALFIAYHREYGINVRIARIFNCYGPRIRADGPYARAVSRFVIQALTDQPLTVYGDGTQTRSFCYITDTTRGLLSFLVCKKAKGEVLNIGNDEETTILDVALKIRQLARSSSTLSFLPLPKDDPKRRCPDITKAKKTLAWKPKIGLQQGLLRTIAWFRNQL